MTKRTKVKLTNDPINILHKLNPRRYIYISFTKLPHDFAIVINDIVKVAIDKRLSLISVMHKRRQVINNNDNVPTLSAYSLELSTDHIDIRILSTTA